MNIKKIIKKYIINKIKKMIKPKTKAPTCGLTNIPTVDNSQPVCDSYISTACVVASKTYNTLGTAINDNLDVIIEALLSRILDNANKTQILQNQVNLLNGSSDWIKNGTIGNAWVYPPNIHLKEFPSYFLFSGVMEVDDIAGDKSFIFPDLEPNSISSPIFNITLGRSGGSLEPALLVIGSGGEITVFDKDFLFPSVGDQIYINLLISK